MTTTPVRSPLTPVQLVDEYFIEMIEVLVAPTVTENTSAANNPSNFVTAVDVDDAVTPSSFGQVCSYASSIQTPGHMAHYHRWEPTFAVAAYAGAFTSYAPTRGWIDCGYPSVEHYAIKIAFGATTTATQVYLTARMTVKFRSLH